MLCPGALARTLNNPFVEEGKVWNMLYNNEEAYLYPSYQYQYYIEGDTLISSLNCKKLYAYNENNDGQTQYKMALHESGGKVYFIPNGSTESYLLYDFQIPEGTSAVMANPIYPEWELEMRNNKDKIIEMNGVIRHCLFVNRVDASFEDFPSGWWIEGIGSELGPLNTWGFEADGNSCYFLNCEVNGQEIFNLSDFQSNTEKDEYYPEGTKWTEIRLDTLKYDSWYSKVGDEWVPNFETIEYYVQGEYTAWDVVFKKVYTNGPEWTDSLTLLISNDDFYGNRNRILVTIPKRHDMGFIMFPTDIYQFDWSIGMRLWFQDLLEANATCYPPCGLFNYGLIDEIKEGDFGGVRPLKYVDLNGKAPTDTEQPWLDYTDTKGGRIIQGIGITEWNDGECLFGPPNPFALTWSYGDRHYRSMLVHFERDGEVLYDVWPEKEAATAVTFTKDQMATIILPTAPDASKGKYYRLDRSEDGKIIFEEEKQPQAHIPYIIVPSEDFSIETSTLDLAGLSPDTVSIKGIDFIGTYTGKVLPSLGGEGGGSFYYDIIDTTPDCTPLPGEGQGERLFIGALRAYLMVNWDDPINHDGSKGPGDKLEIVLKDYGTSIGLTPTLSKGEGVIYDLQGRRLSGKPARGIYIEDGKKKVK